MRILAVALAAAAIGAATGSAQAAGWSPVTGATTVNEQVAAVRDGQGVLHVVWARLTPGSGGESSDVVADTVSPTGAIGAPVVVASGYPSVNAPAIVRLPGGQLEIVFGGIACLQDNCGTGLFASTSADGGATWTAPTTTFDEDQVYGSDLNAVSLPGGSVLETWSHTEGVTVHAGLTSATPDYDFQNALGAGCCGYVSNLATDAAGDVRIAWFSNAAGHAGIFSQAVDPVSGAPVGSAVVMPGSASVEGPTTDARIPIAASGDTPARFYVARTDDAGDALYLWQVGAPTTTLIAQGNGIGPISVVGDPQGGVWVFWADEIDGTPRVTAEQITTAGAGVPLNLGVPKGVVSVNGLLGSVTPSGAPQALAQFDLPNGSGVTEAASATPVVPQSGQSVGVSPVSGVVRVRRPGSAQFVALRAGETIPIGSTVDTTHGRVRLSSATSRRGGIQTADFYDGAFVVGQHRGHALTTLTLTGGNLHGCAAPARRHAMSASARKPTGKPTRKLWGNGHGQFTTVGNTASATVRGTIWLTEDLCQGTYIRVTRDAVTVRDFVHHRTVVVRAPHSYLAAR